MTRYEQSRPEERTAAPGGVGDLTATLDWLAALRQCTVKQAVPLLLTRLEALARCTARPSARFAILRLLKRPLLKATAALPSPDPSLPHGGLPAAGGLTLEQRLDQAMRNNLRTLFYDLDRTRYHSEAATEEERSWVLRNLFKFFRRQVRYALLARQDCPTGTWQALHDLFIYLVVRGHVRVDDSLEVNSLDQDFDPHLEYKRLLLMGRTHQCDLAGIALLHMFGHLTDWARQSRLLDPDSQQGHLLPLLVEVAQDRPLRVDAGILTGHFRGWVLQPDRRFVGYCCAHQRDDNPLAADNPFRASLNR